MPMVLTKRVEFKPAYDKRNEDPAEDYGIHSVTMIATLKGQDGAVSFILYTMWNLPHVEDELYEKSPYLGPIPSSVVVHRKKAQHPDQSYEEDCPYLDGDNCYYSEYTLSAQEVYEALTTEGDEGMWRILLAKYIEVFDIPASTVTLTK